MRDTVGHVLGGQPDDIALDTTEASFTKSNLTFKQIIDNVIYKEINDFKFHV